MSVYEQQDKFDKERSSFSSSNYFANGIVWNVCSFRIRCAWKKIDKANNQSTSNIKIKQDCGSQGKGGYGGHGGDGGNTNGDPSAGGGGGSGGGGGGGPMTTCIAKIYNIQG